MKRDEKLLPKVVKIANIENEITGQSYDVFRFRKVDGSFGVATIGRGKSNDPKWVVHSLLELNAMLPVDAKSAEQLVGNAICREAPKLFKLAAHVGWRDDLTAFVLPRKIVGPRHDLIPPECLQANAFSLDPAAKVDADALASWVKKVAMASRQSSVLT